MNISWMWIALNIFLPLLISITASYLYKTMDGTIDNAKIFASKILMKQKISKTLFYEELIRNNADNMYLLRCTSRKISFSILGLFFFNFAIIIAIAIASGIVLRDRFIIVVVYLLWFLGTVVIMLVINHIFSEESIFDYKLNRKARILRIIEEGRRLDIENEDLSQLSLLYSLIPPTP